MEHLFYTTILLCILGRSTATNPAPSPRATGECTTPGEIICSTDCKSVFYCTRDNADFLQKPVESCSSGAYCDSRAATCNNYLTNCSPTVIPAYVFTCPTVGFYPDPYDCTVYHNCVAVGLNSVPTKCEAGWAFDSLTGRCDLAPTHWVCRDGPLPRCTEGGQTGPVLQNPNLYYVCRRDANGVVRPDLYSCSGNGQYNSVECV